MVTQNSTETPLAPNLSSCSQHYAQQHFPLPNQLTPLTMTQLPSQTPPSAQTKAVLSQVIGCSQDTIARYYIFY